MPSDAVDAASLKIGVVVGSIRKGSLNSQLALALQAMSPPGFAYCRLRIDDLPPYDHDTSAGDASVQRLQREVLACDGLLFVTPEYNRSIPGVLKNAIDHVSRPWGAGAWIGIPAAVIGVSPGMLGTATAQQHLRNVLSCVGTIAMPQPEAFLQAKEGFFAVDGSIVDATTRAFLTTWMAAFTAWVRTHPRSAQPS